MAQTHRDKTRINKTRTLTASSLSVILTSGLLSAILSPADCVDNSTVALSGHDGVRSANAATTLASAETTGKINRALDAGVSKILSRHFTKNGPGAAVLISSHGDVKLRKCYGMTDVAGKQPITPRSVFDLASLSKNFTATAVLLLASQGKLSLTDPVVKVLPDFHVPVKSRAITVSDLVHHLSGLADYTSDDWEGSDEEFRQLTTQTHLQWLNGTKPRRAPGVKWEYNNSGYALLALIVERASGMTFAQFAKTRLFAPAGMKSTVVHDKLGLHYKIPDLVTGYKREKSRTTRSSSWTQITGDGNVLTTIDDMARWDKALRGDTILDVKQKRLAWSSGQLDNHRPINNNGYGYGFGWNTDSENSGIFHDGSWYGTSTYMVRYLDAAQGSNTGLTIVVLTNDENANVEEIADEIETFATGNLRTE
jgi:CubicO group peptidase (beta-lactamase class C family)